MTLSDNQMADDMFWGHLYIIICHKWNFNRCLWQTIAFEPWNYVCVCVCVLSVGYGRIRRPNQLGAVPMNETITFFSRFVFSSLQNVIEFAMTTSSVRLMFWRPCHWHGNTVMEHEKRRLKSTLDGVLFFTVSVSWSSLRWYKLFSEYMRRILLEWSWKKPENTHHWNITIWFGWI